MKSLVFCLLVFLGGGCSSSVIKRDSRGMNLNVSPGDTLSHIRKKIVLLTIYNESPSGGDDLGIVCTEELRRELSRSGDFLVEGHSSLIQSSKEVYAGGGFKLVQAAKKAKLEGVNFILFGRIIEARVRDKTDEIGIVRETKSYTEAKVEIRIFDVLSNKEIYTGTMDGYAHDSSYRFYMSDQEEQLIYRQELLRYAVKVAVRKSIPKILDISARLDWMGRVARVIGSKIYINAGRKSGIHIGDILKVMTEGDDIYDPETGALLGVSQGEVKGTLEIIDFFGPDGTIAVLHSGGSVSEGDFVQLY